MEEGTQYVSLHCLNNVVYRGEGVYWEGIWFAPGWGLLRRGLSVRAVSIAAGWLLVRGRSILHLAQLGVRGDAAWRLCTMGQTLWGRLRKVSGSSLGALGIRRAIVAVIGGGTPL